MRSSGLLTRIDSAKKADFVKNFKQGLKIKSNSEKYKTLGFLQAASGYEFFNKSGVVGDSTITLNPTIFIAGLNAGMLNDTTVFTIAEIDEYLRSTMEKRQKAQVEKQFGANRKAGDDFLVENAKRESVKVTESGLQYEILKEGKGTKPTESDVVKVHYHGTLIDGTVFDSSVERGEPATFGVGQVIKGWTEALQLMPTGSKWKLYIPQELAYGEKNTGSIKPFSALIFEVELLEIEKPAEKK
ncbi:MAG: FKBP-type peptidyl-prolyl cis-trans isomerase [Prevotellaceae bacterium]|nr:FKBP-type peptidyl-prolyl cis-trans isomerase [Prevotellaceae bacterium]